MTKLKTLSACVLLCFTGVVSAGDSVTIGDCVYPVGKAVCGVVSVPGLPNTVTKLSGRQTSFENKASYFENGELKPGPVDLRFYNPILGTFPAPGQTAYVPINTGQYIALEFNSGPGPSFGRTKIGEISWADATTNKGVVELSISNTEGDFDTGPRCHVKHGASAVAWVVGKHQWACELQPNTTYFVNVRFVDCPYDTCHWFVNRAGKL